MTTSEAERGTEGESKKTFDLPVMDNPKQSFVFSIFAALIGLILIVVPFLGDDLAIGLQPYRWPIIVVGLATISAALGAQAVARYKWASAGGSAAMVMIFAAVLKPEPTAPFLYGYIRGSEGFRNMVVSAGSPFLTGRVTEAGDFHFFAREEEIKGAIFTIRAKNVEGALPANIIIGCVPVEILRKYLGQRDGLDLTIALDPSDSEKQRYTLVQTRQGQPLGEWGNPGCRNKEKPPLGAASLQWPFRNILVSSAYAMDPKLTQNPDLVLKALETGELAAQARIQDGIAALRDPKSIAAVVQAWIPASWNSRTDTSLLIAWVRAIRQNRGVAVHIASAMSQQQLDHIVDLAGNPDATVRYNATELLSWILQSTGWPNPPPAQKSDLIVQAVLRPFADTKAFFLPPDGRPPTNPGHSAYNAMVAVDDARCDMREADQKRVLATLAAFQSSPQTKEFDLAKTSEFAKRVLAKKCAK